MSYDLCLFQPPASGDLLQAARARCEGEEGDGPRAGPPLGNAATLRRVADALAAADPTLAAEPNGTGPDAYVELNGPEEGSGLQILVFADTAYLHLPLWHAGDEARAALDQAWGLMAVVEKEFGWRAYDPQLDRVLDLGADREAVLAQYAAGSQAASRLAESFVPPAKDVAQRPWWKFWG